MKIKHNLMAMNANRNKGVNANALSKNLEKLSSGYRINRAADDAAGLAISEKMRAQITGLNAAEKNALDGISLVQTAEGAMQEVQNILNRGVYLATQSANGIYEDSIDRENLQKEMDHLNDEMDRIAKSTNFNGLPLLDGNLGDVSPPSKTSFDISLNDQMILGNASETVTVTIGSLALSVPWGDSGTGGMTGDALTSALLNKYGENGTNATDVKWNGQKFKMTLNGNNLHFEQAENPSVSAEVVVPPQNVSISGTTKVTPARLSGDYNKTGTVTYATYDFRETDPDGLENLLARCQALGVNTACDITVACDNNLDFYLWAGSTELAVNNDRMMPPNPNVINGYPAEFKYASPGSSDKPIFKLYVKNFVSGFGLDDLKGSTFQTGFRYIPEETKALQQTAEVTNAVVGTNGEPVGLRLQIGDTADEWNHITIKIPDLSPESLGIKDISIATQADAQSAIGQMKSVINFISGVRGDLGSIQNRLEHTINNLGVTAENLTAAESRIRDTDMAEEMMSYTKNNILNQAAQAMLTQANQVPQGILQLLQ